MSKITWKSGNFIYPIPAVLVSVGTMEKSNLITVAWTGTINTNPAMLYISVRKERYSYDIIKTYKEFVVNLTTEELAYATDFCGVKSGRDIDKFEVLKLTKQKAKFVNCPMLEESPISIECQVVAENDLGSHTMFIAEVKAINADEKYIDKNGSFDISKCKLIAYSNGGYYALGKKIGKFGYSVQKKKKKTKNNKKK
ncbi:MAG: flavin reductase family protein [Clostridia bacterium]|nr:flavin reductase family protein [Clostridia bacterium]